MVYVYLPKVGVPLLSLILGSLNCVGNLHICTVYQWYQKHFLLFQLIHTYQPVAQACDSPYACTTG